jgi:flagellar protein FlaI
METFLEEKSDEVFDRLKKDVALESEEKYLYFLKRDFLGYGKINVLMLDEYIEDISCNGLKTPIYVWHRKYESLPTNVMYETKEALNRIVNRLTYKTGQQISISQPIVEGTLTEGHRVQVTLEEVSKRGKTFTIRKYRQNPYTVIDLINFGTLSPKIAAFLWVLVENIRSIMVCGATASGKTSLLNSISMFMNPEMKVVTIEEVRELRLHENWIPLVTRPSYQPGVKEITLYDLLKSALRQRPDYIIVGEVRGEEAYTLFQSLAVGHGGLCTIHADSIDSVMKRLVSRPMNIPELMLPLMNVLIQINRVKIQNGVERRVTNVTEIINSPGQSDIHSFENIELKTRFEWDPISDTFKQNEISELGSYNEYYNSIYSLISKTNHVPLEKLIEEQVRREIVLKWMVKNNLKSHDEVTRIIRSYYLNPEEIFQQARLGYT